MHNENDTESRFLRILHSDSIRKITGLVLAGTLIVTATVPTIAEQSIAKKEAEQSKIEAEVVKQDVWFYEAQGPMQSLNLRQVKSMALMASITTTSTTTSTTQTPTTASETTTTTVATISIVEPEEEPDEGCAEEYEETYEETYEESYDDSYVEEYVDTYSTVVSDAEYILLCNAVANEAGSNWISTADKAKVCEVILNRTYSESYPNTIYGVITQPYQFSGCWGYADLGSFSGSVTEDVKSAVSGYLDGLYSNHGYYSFHGDGYQNYFS